MQPLLVYLFIGGFALFLLNVVGPMVAVWDWFHKPVDERRSLRH